MNMQDTINVIQSNLANLTLSEVAGLADAIDEAKQRETWDREHGPLVSIAIRRELRDRFRDRWASRGVGAWINYYRHIPNYQPNMRVQAESEAVLGLLENLYGESVTDDAIDEFDRENDPDGVGWPAFLADRFQAMHDARK